MGQEKDFSRSDWKKGGGLIPAIVQDVATLRVLMLGYMNEASFEATQSTGFVTFFSRSKQRLWQKGETSGNRLRLVSIALDCDGDTFLVKTEPEGPACHTGAETCFGEDGTASLSVLADLAKTVRARRGAKPEESYTALLFAEGMSRMAQKVGEEGVEVALAAVTQSPTLREEAADLLYHLLVVLEASGCGLDAVLEVLAERADKKAAR